MTIEECKDLDERLHRVVADFNSIGKTAMLGGMMLTTQIITESQINGGSREILTANLYVRPSSFP